MITEEEFYNDLRQNILADANSRGGSTLETFMSVFADDLQESGFIDGYEFCHLSERGLGVDGHWLSEDDEVGAGTILSLFIADYDDREGLESLTETEVRAIFKRLDNFFKCCYNEEHYNKYEETGPEYSLARNIYDRRDDISSVRCILCSDRSLSRRLKELETNNFHNIRIEYHIWDISRLCRQFNSKGKREALDINFEHIHGASLPCLLADEGASSKSYLAVIPGTVLADIYELYGARLLEQNVRSFLQVRGKVNKGIKQTLLHEPEMLFPYNNGITATAQSIELKKTDNGLHLVQATDLQIVNGGQTVASLFHTRRKDDADLKKTAVQMKITVLKHEKTEQIVQKISEYANTQNRVNAADFFANHPFHIRMEKFSRRLWAPAVGGSQRETKWFYERARGQYDDEQSTLTRARKKLYQEKAPKKQKFTKTDLAKFENVWDEDPRWVNLGAQKNFGKYALRLGEAWNKNKEQFNESYYKQLVARAICFKTTEKIVSIQDWYNGGYRANIVAYTLALVAEICSGHGKYLDFQKIWMQQQLSDELKDTLSIIAFVVHEHLINPPQAGQNVSEWAKQAYCWQKLKEKIDGILKQVPDSFINTLIDKDEKQQQLSDASKLQKLDDKIASQAKVLNIGADVWSSILSEGREKQIFSDGEISLLKIATQLPNKIPSESQSAKLIKLLNKATDEGISVSFHSNS